MARLEISLTVTADEEPFVIGVSFPDTKYLTRSVTRAVIKPCLKSYNASHPDAPLTPADIAAVHTSDEVLVPQTSLMNSVKWGDSVYLTVGPKVEPAPPEVDAVQADAEPPAKKPKLSLFGSLPEAIESPKEPPASLFGSLPQSAPVTASAANGLCPSAHPSPINLLRQCCGL